MLSDRPYMRDAYQRERTSFLVWLVSALLAGFVVQLIFSSVLDLRGFERLGALSSTALRHGEVWTLITYPFLHRGALHLLAVLLGLFFIGRELAPIIGDRRLAWLALISSVAGGLVWFGFHFRDAGAVMGATTILWCYLAVFACLFPNREISFLVFFVLPVTTRPKYVVWTLAVIDLVGLVASEILPDRAFDYHVPHSAHLAALLVGWVYYRYFHETSWLTLPARRDVELPRWMQRGKKSPAPAASPAAVPSVASRQEIRAELDRILDKINSHGLASLTAEEKRLLDNAKAHLSRG
jgi:membrane associated rhomboid family serine protease